MVRFLSLAVMLGSAVALAAPPQLKLPFPAGDTWTLTRGYFGATHLNYGPGADDRYAIDFAETGCDSLGKPILAAAKGTVEIRSLTDQGGYGKHLLVHHADGYTTRYAHLAEILVEDKQWVEQGEILGIVGNTGSVSGAACPLAPGLHLHFALYHDGVGAKPEPISGYQNLATGGAYTSDNEEPSVYTYSDNLTTCSDVSGGADTDWYFRCNHEQSVFTYGQTVHALARLTQVHRDHRFRVDTFRDGDFRWSWTTDWNQVEPHVWEWSHFWPTLSDGEPGSWEFLVSVDTAQGWDELDRAAFEIVTSQPGYHYALERFACRGPLSGGWWTNWYYTCQNPTNHFLAGETVQTLIRLEHVSTHHRYRVDAYRDDQFQWNWSPDWNWVSGTWRYSHFWPTLSNAESGTWRFDFLLDTGTGYHLVDQLTFFVE